MFRIPESELKVSFSRSSGAGGQNVNKVESKATIRWDFRQSLVLSEEQKQRLEEKLENRLNALCELQISSQKNRFQSRNRIAAVGIMNQLVNAALKTEPKRKPTKTPRRIKEKRLKEKQHQSKKKESRRVKDY